MIEYLLSGELIDYLQSHGLTRWLLPVGAWLLTWALGWGLVRFVWSRLLTVAKSSQFRWFPLVVTQARFPVQALAFVVACSAGLSFAPEMVANHPLTRMAPAVILILLGAWIVARAASITIQYMPFPGEMSEGVRNFLNNVVRVSILALGLLIVLDTLGISIRPVLASLGIGSIAVALALQDTLNNFFSGFYILVDRPVREGDYIRIDSTNVEGIVQRIGWRSTRLHSLSNTLIVIPNSKLSSSILINLDLPESTISLTVTLGVSYDANLAQVEKITLEVARQIQENLPQALSGFEPGLRYHTFGDSAILFNVGLRARKYDDTFLVKHEFIKALHERFKREGIEIPFPQQVVHLEKST